MGMVLGSLIRRTDRMNKGSLRVFLSEDLFYGGAFENSAVEALDIIIALQILA